MLGIYTFTTVRSLSAFSYWNLLLCLSSGLTHVVRSKSPVILKTLFYLKKKKKRFPSAACIGLPSLSITCYVIRAYFTLFLDVIVSPKRFSFLKSVKKFLIVRCFSPCLPYLSFIMSILTFFPFLRKVAPLLS